MHQADRAFSQSTNRAAVTRRGDVNSGALCCKEVDCYAALRMSGAVFVGLPPFETTKSIPRASFNMVSYQFRVNATTPKIGVGTDAESQAICPPKSRFD